MTRFSSVSLLVFMLLSLTSEGAPQRGTTCVVSDYNYFAGGVVFDPPSLVPQPVHPANVQIVLYSDQDLFPNLLKGARFSEFLFNLGDCSFSGTTMDCKAKKWKGGFYQSPIAAEIEPEKDIQSVTVHAYEIEGGNRYEIFMELQDIEGTLYKQKQWFNISECKF